MRALILCACLAALSLIAPGRIQAGKASYELVEFIPPGEQSGNVVGIADSGQCLIWAERPDPNDTNNRIRTSYRWNGKSFTALKPIARAPNAESIAISRSGKVVGYCRKQVNGNQVNLPVVWKGERPKRLAYPRGERRLVPQAISPNGRVAGFDGDSGRPWTSKGKSFRWLDFPFAASGGLIWAINVHDVMVGTARYQDLTVGKPAVWSAKSVEELPIPDGFVQGYAFDISDQSEIVGAVGTSGFYPSAPILWRKGAAIQIGSLGGDRGEALSINNTGQVVGSSRIAGANAPDHGFLWTEAGGMTDLNDLLSPADQALWEITGAGQINNQGWMIVSADSRKGPSRTVSFLMRPAK